MHPLGPLPRTAVKVFRSSRSASCIRIPVALSVSKERRQTLRCYSQPASHNDDHRSRLSRIWAPSGGIAVNADEDAHSKLLRAGFLRQAHSGIFHLLPLGLRVQEKIERLIDRHMSSLGASKLALSSISSGELWRKSGRLAKVNSELLQFKDRKGTEYLLSPTHEEEITCLIANSVKSYKELPIRLYQISRKYRDEIRPRHGLLRSREFVMKDLYTFDYNTSLALETYDQVRKAYTALFDELKISYLVADADSGDMGGDLSHEYHFPTPQGEDHIISCDSCNYVANEELAQSSKSSLQPRDGVQWKFVDSAASKSTVVTEPSSTMTFSVWRGVSRDRSTLVNVWYSLVEPVSTVTSRPSPPEINTHAVKLVVPTLDSGVEDAASLWVANLNLPNLQLSEAAECSVLPSIINLVDYRLPPQVLDMISSENSSLAFWPGVTTDFGQHISSSVISKDPSNHELLDLLRIRDGDSCPRCDQGKLHVQKAIELGHTFFLGTRYSKPLNALIALPEEMETFKDTAISSENLKSNSRQSSSTKVPMQMGCHGIGVSRMIGAVAETLADQKGLNWPRLIAPYEVVVIPIKGCESSAVDVYDALIGKLFGARGVIPKVHEVALDDRDHPFPWKMNDADLIGYPVIVVVGRSWKKDQSCQVQCRRLNIKEDVPVAKLSDFVNGLLLQL